MGQVYDFTIEERQRNLLLLLLNQSPSNANSFAEARKFDRAGDALEKKVDLHDRSGDADGEPHVCKNTCEVVVRLTHENVEVLSGIVLQAMKPRRGQGGEDLPPPLTVAGFRILRSAVDKLEAAQKGNPTEGVEVLSLEQVRGNGKDKSTAEEG